MHRPPPSVPLRAIATTHTNNCKVSLSDGSAIQYQRNGQDQIVALTRSRIQTPWLQWLLPAKVLLQNIERDIVGLKSYACGNGIEAQFQRSREGSTARQEQRQ
ncbi:hypothetical protein [Collimonas antrihumi]|uniref:hypothetical protein n=1 Tax=Collimonas antrihumi TaxID=1940615 RepID=UPI001B8DA792|nr:hypothetical protein [Collimonas antrihumi]